MRVVLVVKLTKGVVVAQTNWAVTPPRFEWTILLV